MTVDSNEQPCTGIRIVHFSIIDLHLIYVAMKWHEFNWRFGTETVNLSKYSNKSYEIYMLYAVYSPRTQSIVDKHTLTCTEKHKTILTVTIKSLEHWKPHLLYPMQFKTNESQWRHNYFLVQFTGKSRCYQNKMPIIATTFWNNNKEKDKLHPPKIP